MKHTPQLSLSVLGSTGSIGMNTLDVLRANPENFTLVGLSAGQNIARLHEQILEFHPRRVCVADDLGKEELLRLGVSCQVLVGTEGMRKLVQEDDTQAIVVGTSGFAAFEPVISALESGKHLALANKECLVAGGEVFRGLLAASGSLVVPVDSEHNSIHQCLRRRGYEEVVKRIILTASGGPFLGKPLDELAAVTPEMAVRHPRWNMGAKISVDSATLMNKALEVIEASVLFPVQPSQIEVLIHPESVVHGLVEYADGTVIAALYEPDMKVPIANALQEILRCTPSDSPMKAQTIGSGNRSLDLSQISSLNFLKPDPLRFPALDLAYKVIERGQGSGAVFNAANEVAVSAFLASRVLFSDILPLVSSCLEAYWKLLAESGDRESISIADIKDADSWGREQASKIIHGMSSSSTGRIVHNGKRDQIPGRRAVAS